MAVAAPQVRVVKQHGAVHGSDILHLDRDLAVAVYTAVGHHCRFPRRGVTGAAVPACPGVGAHPSQHLSRFRVQRSRVVHETASNVGKTGNDEGGEQGCNEPGSRQTSEAIASHAASLIHLRNVA